MSDRRSDKADPHASGVAWKSQARRIFLKHLAQFGDCAAASRAAGISERTGRRWRGEMSARLSRASLVAEPTSFVGREAELSQLAAEVGSGARVVTVIGPPGIGKTRLAMRIVRRRLASGSDVLFADLRQVLGVDDLCAGLAQALEIRLAQGRDPRRQVETLGSALAARGPCLVALDNVEQLARPAVDAIGEWVCQTSEVVFLATSRRVLHLADERLFELGPLPVDGGLHGKQAAGDAVRLFCERAREAEPALDLRMGLLSEEMPMGGRDPMLDAVVQLVRRLEGNPLAIELAAAQMRRLSPTELLSHLRGTNALGLRLVDSGTVHRRTSLRHAIETSWRLLTPPERTVLCQLTVFCGGFTKEAASAVVDLGVSAGGLSVANAVTQLREASLLRVSDASDPAGSRRWDFYEAVREFAVERLGAAAAEALKVRHAAYYLDFARTWCQRIPTSRGPQARRVLMTELDNLREAVAWHTGAVSCSDTGSVVAMVLAFSEAVRPWVPGLALQPLSDALRCIESSSASDDDRARLLVARAMTHVLTADCANAVADLAAADRLHHITPAVRAELECEQAFLHWTQGAHALARPLLERVVVHARKHTNARLEARARTHLAMVLAEAYLDPRAFEYYAQAAAMFYETGDFCAATMTRKAWCVHRVFFGRGDPGEDLEQQVALLGEFNEREAEGRGLTGLGVYYAERGEMGRALECLDRARAIGERAGIRPFVAIAYTRIANCFEESGRIAEAQLAYEQAIRGFVSVGDTRNIGLVCIFLAGLLARHGQATEANEQLDRARSLFDALGRTGFEPLLELQHAQVDLCLGQQARERGDEEQAASLRASAVRRLEEARRPLRHTQEGVTRLPLLRCSPEARFLVRLIERELDRPEAWVLRVWRDGRAFQVGSADPVVLSRGPVMRRVLAALAAERSRASGEPVSVERLLAAGWPAERMLPRAGVARVRTLINRLRRAGLRDVLLTSESGYLLDPVTPIRIEAPERPLPRRAAECPPNGPGGGSAPPPQRPRSRTR